MGNSFRLTLLSLLFILFLYIQFFHGLSQLGLVGPDEPRYAQVAREMMVSGDYVTPRLYGKPWFEKPILYYWLAAHSYKLLGVSESAARLPAALSAIVLILAVFTIGWKWRSWRCGSVAALMLASSPICISLARAASMDMLLTAALTLSLGGFYFGFSGPTESGAVTQVRQSESSRIFLYAFYLFLGVALLAKGPVSMVLVGLILIVFFTIQPDIFSLRKLRPIQGGILFLAVALPWYILCFHANGWVFINDFLFQHNLARFTTDRFQHSQPFWFFLVVIAIGFLPWTLHFGAACFQDLKRWRSAKRRDFGPDRLFFWVWAIVPLVFFSLSRSKLPGYILPVFPAIALLTASYWEDCLKDPSQQPAQSKLSRVEVFQSILMISAGAGLVIWGNRLNLGVASSLSLLAWLILGLGCAGLVLIFLGCYRAVLLNYLAGVSLVILLIIHQIFPQIDAIESSRQLALILKHQDYQAEPVFVYGVSRRIAYGLSFYLNSEAHIIYSLDEVDVQGARSFYLLTASSGDSIGLRQRFKVEREVPLHTQRLWKLRVNDVATPR